MSIWFELLPLDYWPYLLVVCVRLLLLLALRSLYAPCLVTHVRRWLRRKLSKFFPPLFVLRTFLNPALCKQVVFACSSLCQERLLCQYRSNRPRRSLCWKFSPPHTWKKDFSNRYHDGYSHWKFPGCISSGWASQPPLFYSQDHHSSFGAGLPPWCIRLGYVIQVSHCCGLDQSIWVFLCHTWRRQGRWLEKRYVFMLHMCLMIMYSDTFFSSVSIVACLH